MLPRLILIGGDGGYSGVPTYIRQTIAARTDRARITVISDANRGGYDFLSDTGAEHIVLPGLRSSMNPLAMRQTLHGLRDALGQHPGSFVWAHARMGVFLSRLLALRHPDLLPRLAITYHGIPFDPGHRPLLSGGSRLIEAQLLKRSPAQDLIFLSEGASQRMQRALGAKAMAQHRVHVLPNCSDLGQMPPREAPQPGVGPRVIMTGRVSYQKNFEAAARVFSHLPDNAHLTLCGGGTDSAAFRARLAGLLGPDALNRVRFVGPVADVRPYLARADVFLLTSRYEGMPIGALEAFEAGLPVALSDIPGTSEILTLHPLSRRLKVSDPAGGAAAITALTQAFRADPAGHQARIHSVWASVFSAAQWARRMQVLWTQISGPVPQDAAARIT